VPDARPRRPPDRRRLRDRDEPDLHIRITGQDMGHPHQGAGPFRDRDPVLRLPALRPVQPRRPARPAPPGRRRRHRAQHGAVHRGRRRREPDDRLALPDERDIRPVGHRDRRADLRHGRQLPDRHPRREQLPLRRRVHLRRAARELHRRQRQPCQAHLVRRERRPGPHPARCERVPPRRGRTGSSSSTGSSRRTQGSYGTPRLARPRAATT
jgi:hypothetical protein